MNVLMLAVSVTPCCQSFFRPDRCVPGDEKELDPMFDQQLARLLITKTQRYASKRHTSAITKAELYLRRADLLWDLPASGWDDAVGELFWFVIVTFVDRQICLFRVAINMHGGIDCQEYPFYRHKA